MSFYLGEQKCSGVGLEESSFLIASPFSVKWELSRAISENEDRDLQTEVKFCNCL